MFIRIKKARLSSGKGKGAIIIQKMGLFNKDGKRIKWLNFTEHTLNAILEKKFIIQTEKSNN